MITIIDITDKDNFSVVNIDAKRYTLEVSGGENDHTIQLVMDVENKLTGAIDKMVLCEYAHMDNLKYARMDSVLSSCRDFVISRYHGVVLFANPSVLGNRLTLANAVMEIIQSVYNSLTPADLTETPEQQGEEQNG